MFDEDEVFISLDTNELITYDKLIADVFETYPMYGGTRDFDYDLVCEYMEDMEIIPLSDYDPTPINCQKCCEEDCICTVSD